MKRIILTMAAVLTIIGAGLALAHMTDGSGTAAMAEGRTLATAPQPVPSPAPGEIAPPPGVAENYPGPATVDLLDSVVGPGSTTATTIVRLSKPPVNTVFAFVRCTRGSGKTRVGDRTTTVIFRPGDPLEASATCPVQSASEGDTISFVQVNEPDGAKRGVAKATARVNSTQTPTEPITAGFRSPYSFAPYGELAYSADATSLAFADQGGPGIWSTSLPHGRTQPGNNENGYYGTVAMGAIREQADGIAMRSIRLEQPFDAGDGRQPYPFLASVLSAHKSPDLQFRYGSVEWVAKMPGRKGSWPALWLLPTTGWPPEIDVYEGFSYNGEWKPDSSLSTALHGGKNNKRAFVRNAFRMKMADFGLAPTLTSEFHKFQVTVEPGWITMFVDGVETSRYANPFPGTNWHPLMTVAVKTDRDAAYDTGSGDMIIKSVRVWKAE